MYLDIHCPGIFIRYSKSYIDITNKLSVQAVTLFACKINTSFWYGALSALPQVCLSPSYFWVQTKYMKAACTLLSVPENRSFCILAQITFLRLGHNRRTVWCWSSLSCPWLRYSPRSATWAALSLTIALIISCLMLEKSPQRNWAYFKKQNKIKHLHVE